MALSDKIIAALQKPLDAEFISLDVDDGISGFVVASRFDGLSGIDRQVLIDSALRTAADPISADERQQILMIAGLTPIEYESIGTRIRVQKINDLADGSLEVFVVGGYSDAKYVRGMLSNQKGVQTSEPEQRTETLGTLMSFRAKGTATAPLTKASAMSVLQGDQYIQVMQNS